MFDKFTKFNLKDGMVVKTKCGEKFLVKEENGALRLINNLHCISNSSIKNDLTNLYGRDWDIIQVFEKARIHDVNSLEQMIQRHRKMIFERFDVNYKPKTKDFTKADLKDGMVVELRSGKSLLVVKRGENLKMLSKIQYYSGEDVTEDLKEKDVEKRGELDIVKVFAPAPLEKVSNILDLIEIKGELLWERKEKMTLEEVEQELGYRIEIIEENKP